METKKINEVLDYLISNFKIDINQPSPITVPGMSRYTLASMFSELGFMKGVEIGVQAGKYSTILCRANPIMEFYGIDPYEEYPDVGIPGEQEGQDRGYEIAKASVPSNCTLIRKKSMDAVGDFPDRYFDFVYIDGNHIFSYVANDIFEWSKKIRKGGIIAGHDYRRYYPRSFIHVYQVVNGYTEAYAIKPWFLTDNSTENVRSFFWIKQ